MSNLELKRLLYRYREEIIEDLQLEGEYRVLSGLLVIVIVFAINIVVEVVNVIIMNVIIVI